MFVWILIAILEGGPTVPLEIYSDRWLCSQGIESATDLIKQAQSFECRYYELVPRNPYEGPFS